jgi:hypothetical protein
MGSAIGGKETLHAPHRPVSATCFAGIRFGFPQDGQFRMIGIADPLSKDAAQTAFVANESPSAPLRNSLSERRITLLEPDERFNKTLILRFRYQMIFSVPQHPAPPPWPPSSRGACE